jgi:hypothetical protein
VGYRKCRRAKNVERNVNGGCVVGHANVGCVNGTYIWSERADAIVSYNGVEDASDRSEIQETITTSTTPCNILL